MRLKEWRGNAHVWLVNESEKLNLLVHAKLYLIRDSEYSKYLESFLLPFTIENLILLYIQIANGFKFVKIKRKSCGVNGLIFHRTTFTSIQNIFLWHCYSKQTSLNQIISAIVKLETKSLSHWMPKLLLYIKQFICSANQIIGFYVMSTLAFNELSVRTSSRQGIINMFKLTHFKPILHLYTP